MSRIINWHSVYNEMIANAHCRDNGFGKLVFTQYGIIKRHSSIYNNACIELTLQALKWFSDQSYDYYALEQLKEPPKPDFLNKTDLSEIEKKASSNFNRFFKQYKAHISDLHWTVKYLNEGSCIKDFKNTLDSLIGESPSPNHKMNESGILEFLLKYGDHESTYCPEMINIAYEDLSEISEHRYFINLVERGYFRRLKSAIEIAFHLRNTISNDPIKQKIFDTFNDPSYQAYHEGGRKILHRWQYHNPMDLEPGDRYELDKDAYIKEIAKGKGSDDEHEVDCLEILLAKMNDATITHPTWKRYYEYLKRRLSGKNLPPSDQSNPSQQQKTSTTIEDFFKEEVDEIPLHSHPQNKNVEQKEGNITPLQDKELLYDGEAIHNILKPLSGYWKKRAILNVSDFNRLKQYINSIIEDGTLSKGAENFNSTTTPNQFITKTIHLVYVEIGRNFKPEFLKLIRLFCQFNKTEKDTTLNSKFSTYEGNYSSDCETLITYQ